MDDMNLATLERIAVALEQIALELGTRNPSPSRALPMEGEVERFYPPVTYTAATSYEPPNVTFPAIGWRCPEHGGSRIVPAGVSGKTGKPYAAFVVCAEQRCEQKPPRVLPGRVLP